MPVSLERVAIAGSAGQLGRELARAFGKHAIPLERQDLDVTDAESIATVLRRFRPTVLIDAAAYHDLAECELHPERAFEVNAVAVARLTSACDLAECAFAYVSTDYVFDGSARRPYLESDEPHPLSVYGVSKLAGERLTLRNPSAYVFRTSGLYAVGGSRHKGATFVERIIRQAQADEPIRVVDDVTFSPSYAPHVAAQIHAILARGAPGGVYHVTNAGACTWYEFARAALRVAGYDREIAAVSHTAFDTSVRRPLYSALDHGAIRKAGVAEPPPWIEGLTAYVASAELGSDSRARS
ncbi:MAG: dTDP-4-dehydrorhamnose reductase [Candidatus Eremiobacteraeota bacterium]|nr:dTDP-4-dehydrorhamnose reductase [Candidatus Eremiobacteraeota bacterium]